MGGANVYRWRTKVRNGGANVYRWRTKVRESGVACAQRRRRRCVGVAGRLCASGVAGAREMVASGKTKLMHLLFPIRFVFSHFSEKNRNEHQ